jgi:tetratricopeptide (TPR) repeat protein
MAGRFEEANAAFDRCRQLIHELGDPVRAKISTQVDGEALRLEGRSEDAERLFRSMIDTLDAMGETGFNSTSCALLAHTLCDQGRFDEAEAFVERSRELAAEDDFASQASWRMAQARVLADRGEVEDALRLADEAVAINVQTDYLSWQGDGLEVKGMVLETAGRDDDARGAYEESLDRFERKGNVVAADRVRERMRR